MTKMTDRRNRELTDEDSALVANKACRDFKTQNGKYEDVAGLYKIATLDEIKKHDYVFTPGCYVGSEEVEEDDEAYADKMVRLTAELDEQFTKSHELEIKIKENLGQITYGE